MTLYQFKAFGSEDPPVFIKRTGIDGPADFPKDQIEEYRWQLIGYVHAADEEQALSDVNDLLVDASLIQSYDGIDVKAIIRG